MKRKNPETSDPNNNLLCYFTILWVNLAKLISAWLPPATAVRGQLAKTHWCCVSPTLCWPKASQDKTKSLNTGKYGSPKACQKAFISKFLKQHLVNLFRSLKPNHMSNSKITQSAINMYFPRLLGYRVQLVRWFGQSPLPFQRAMQSHFI